ncbi:hypothetical protein HYS49_00865 [Candidatus Woesearchaeota archaeon]|nr:hypothetical protein [Candidatus Woesearchaeota archaeon]
MEPNALVTIPPYAPFIDDVARHPFVSGLRLNTVMPVKGTLEDTLKRLQDNAREKELWIDLKCRQLRVKTYGVPPFTSIELTHQITVNTPVTAYFHGGEESATVLEVDGNRLIMQEGPKRVIGPGESVNIPDPSLHIDGYFTETDKRYIEAAITVGLHRYMLSFVERPQDITELLVLDPKAQAVLKIESMKGLEYVENQWNGEGHLMAARGDLYLEVQKPHHLLAAVEGILTKDKDAIVASRICSSFASSLEPSCADIGDIDNLLRMGYLRFMLGDEVCMQRESVLSALNLLSAIALNYRE